MYKILLTISFVFFIQGCSNQAIYNNIQYNKLRECEKLPEPQYTECLNTLGESYEDYQQAREQLAE